MVSIFGAVGSQDRSNESWLFLDLCFTDDSVDV